MRITQLDYYYTKPHTICRHLWECGSAIHYIYKIRVLLLLVENWMHQGYWRKNRISADIQTTWPDLRMFQQSSLTYCSSLLVAGSCLKPPPVTWTWYTSKYSVQGDERLIPVISHHVANAFSMPSALMTRLEYGDALWRLNHLHLIPCRVDEQQHHWMCKAHTAVITAMCRDIQTSANSWTIQTGVRFKA